MLLLHIEIKLVVERLMRWLRIPEFRVSGLATDLPISVKFRGEGSRRLRCALLLLASITYGSEDLGASYSGWRALNFIQMLDPEDGSNETLRNIDIYLSTLCNVP